MWLQPSFIFMNLVEIGPILIKLKHLLIFFYSPIYWHSISSKVFTYLTLKNYCKTINNLYFAGNYY